MKQAVRFVENPPALGGPEDPRSLWFQRLRLVAERPGEWAEVYSGTRSACHQAAQRLRLRRYHVPPGAWDFTVRSFRRGHLALHRDSESRAILYARYRGLEEEAFSDAAVDRHRQGAVWDQYGRRICPVCEREPLPIPDAGPYVRMCHGCRDAAPVFVGSATESAGFPEGNDGDAGAA